MKEKLKFFILALATILILGSIALFMSLWVIVIFFPSVEPWYEILGKIVMMIAFGFIIFAVVVIIAEKVCARAY